MSDLKSMSDESVLRYYENICQTGGQITRGNGRAPAATLTD
jgi:hypothetical protein